ncbi:MAG TPA: F0F1 ATP synthase subunit A [Candidatus Woesebacteria bacterium]|mgnify:CR=1 FL=1|nr:F0F1 ATP synthase subunit A [Candidatus Woesebacteria bacterium]
MSSGIHISLNAETLFHIGSLPVTNSMFTSLLVSLMLLIFAIIFRTKFNARSIRPTGIQNFAEWLVEVLFGLVHSVTGDLKKSRHFFPALSTFFLFIILNNWLGLIPGVGTIGITHQQETYEEVLASESEQTSFSEIIQPALAATEEVHGEAATGPSTTHSVFVPIFRPGTADLNTTFALSLISVFLIQYFGFKYLSFSYFKKFINFSNPINFYVGILETISEFARIISFAFRLFGNIFAGEVLIVVIAYLTKVLVPVPFYGLEIFVGFIQALVFTMLSLVFYNMATAKSH